MAGKPIDSVKNLCSIVQERDKEIREADVRIEYYKNALEKVNDEIKRIEKNRRKMAEQMKFIDKENEQLEFIQNSLKFGQEVSWQSLINHQYIERLTAKELEAKEKESQVVKQECHNLYSKAQEELEQNPLYQELEKQKVEFLKADIQRRELEVKIRKRKSIIAQKKEIEKRIFYNFFIEMAEEYVMEKRIEELKNLKIQEIQSVKRLFAVQEEVKMRQKLGTPRDKIKTMTNITFGSQDLVLGKNNMQSKVCDLPQQKRTPVLLNEKLDNLFQQDESKNVVAVPKVNILNQKVITPPAFVVPQFAPAPAEKRKNKIVDLSCKWQKLIKHSSFSKSSPNRNKENMSQPSQQSQLSQPEQLTPEIHVVKQHHEYPIKNTDTNKPFIQTKENQGISNNIKEMVPPFQYQMVENMGVGDDQFKMKYPQVMTETSYYDANKNDKPLTENNYTNRPTTQDPQRVLIQMRNKEPPVQYQAVENLNVGTEQFNLKSSLVASSALQEPLISSAEMISGRTNPTPDVTYARSNVSVPKTDIVPDHGKSVRFNLEQTNRPTEPKFVLGGGRQSMFANLFTPFSTQAPNKNEILLQEQPAGTTNDTFNLSLMEQDGENFNSPNGIEFDSDENRIRSPECTYEVERGVHQQFKPPEMSSFGSGFFPFGKNLFNPF